MQQFTVSKSILFLMVTFLCNLLYFNARAQFSVGIEGGYNKNYLVTNNANRAFTNYRPVSGFSVGLPVQYKITDWFALAADPSLIQKNYSQVRSDFFTGVYENTRNAYVQLPVMAHFMFGGKQLKGFLNTGVYGGYWMSSKVKGEMPNILDIADGAGGSSVYDYENPYSYNEKHVFDNRKDNRFEAGWLAGLGVSYSISDRYEIFSEARMLYSFTDMQKKYMLSQVPRYNTTYGIHAGILIRFNKENNDY